MQDAPRSTSRTRHWPHKLAETAAIVVIGGYRAIFRPLLIGSCKFYPTCSDYALQAVREHGLPYGGWLALRRLLRCHPFALGGLDPVPPGPWEKAGLQSSD